MGYHEHRQTAAGISVRCSVITLSDTRNEQTDKSGQKIRQLLADSGHETTEYRIIRDEPQELAALLKGTIARDDIDAVLTNGGTGISQRDCTIDVVEKVIEQPLPGFGELFRMLSWQEIGSGAMLSRAAGGVVGRKLLFAMPGSTAAVELAMTKLILPEMGHLVKGLRK
jgi:molybdopterin adenylyltransferase